MSRRVLLIAAITAVVVVAGGAVTAILLTRGSDSRHPHTVAGARKLAARACAEEAQLVDLVRRNATAPKVFRASKRAADDATAASLADSTWVQLASGLQLLDAALHHDDAPATQEALDLVAAHCTPTPH